MNGRQSVRPGQPDSGWYRKAVRAVKPGKNEVEAESKRVSTPFNERGSAAESPLLSPALTRSGIAKVVLESEMASCGDVEGLEP
jgi:hypothetical protein